MKVRALLMLMVFSAALAPAQDKVTLVPRRLLLDVVPAAGSAFTAADALLIARSLDQKIQEADPALVVLESTGEPGQTSDEALQTLANNAGADCWALIAVEGDWSSARVKVHAVDPIAKATVADVTVSRTAWVSSAGLSLETWTDVAPAIAGKFPMTERTAAGGETTPLARLTIRALPGTVITGLQKAPLRVDETGIASSMLPPNREYTLRASLHGYVPVKERLFLSEDRQIDLKQERSAGRELEVSLTDAQAPGVDLTLQSPELFVRVGFVTYVAGLVLSQTQLFLSEPLTVVAVQFGTWILPEDQFFRPYVALAGFIRIVHASGWPVMVDPLAPVGLRLAVGLEVPASRGHAYFEYTPTLYYSPAPDAFRAALGTGDLPGWWGGPTSAMTIFSFRVGYRWPL